MRAIGSLSNRLLLAISMLVGVPFLSSAQDGRGTGYLSLDGSGYLSLPNSSALAFGGTAPFTVECWVRSSQRSEVDVIVSRLTTNPNLGSWEFAYGAGSLHFKREVSPFWLYGTRLVPLNTFTHVAAVYDGSKMKTFINGVQDNETTSGASSSASSVPLFIGARMASTGPDRLFTGGLDEVRIWSKALSVAELGALVNGEVPPAGTANLEAYWRMESFEDLSVGTAGVNDIRDESGKGRHISLEGEGELGSNLTPGVSITEITQGGAGIVNVEYKLIPSDPRPSTNHAISLYAIATDQDCETAPTDLQLYDDITGHLTGDLTLPPEGGVGILTWSVGTMPVGDLRTKYYAANRPVLFRIVATPVSAP
ncbi:hypothetical protein GC173_07965 [bacterium]|nr:hypothetical protein [bacterium]